METWWRQLGRGMVLVAGVNAMLAAYPGTALDLRVQGRSQLDATANAAGTHLLVRGELRDDLNKPLPQRNVGVAVFNAATDQRVDTRTVRTDRRGKFATRYDLSPGRYRVTIRFESTTHVTGTVFDETVEVERQPARLTVDGPELVYGNASPVHLSVAATVGGVGLSLPVEIQTRAGRSIRRQLDESGRSRIDVVDLLTPGTNTL
ncbi:MAG: carboxypeptidase-like regulatory domain-containing protein, partial [Bradymonadaceae bacterium]